MAVMMKALVIEEYGNLQSLHLKDVPVPTPRAHQVLIRVEYAPLNPADLEFINGTHSHRRPLPAIPGFEGSGTVVKSGGGFTAWNLVNKKVAFKQEDPGLDGSWAEYIVVDVKLVTVIKEGVALEQAACFYVNALTVMMFADVIENEKHKAIMQNAAACSIGKMLLRWCNYHDIKCINIIRREEQANQLKELAADVILNSETENFETELRILSQRYEVSAAFDCIGGSLSGIMLESLCDYGVLYVHGKISKQPISGISPSSFIFRGKKVQGLWVRPWFHGLSRMKRMAVMQKIQNLDFIFRTDIVGVYSIEQFREAIEIFPSTRSSGKLLFKLKPDETVPKRHLTQAETGLWKFTELSAQDAEALIERYKTPESRQASEHLGWLDIRPIQQEGLIYHSARLLDDGRIYDGQWDRDTAPHGTGVMYYPDGSRFEGLWNEGRKQKGRMITSKGEVYNGDWDNDCLQGSGSYLSPDVSYEGEWKHGQFHGTGTLNYANESKYTGSFKEGKRQGKGIWTSSTGEDYQGHFENNEMHGEGIYKCKSYEYKGTFEHGVMKGQGTILFNDGRVFNGELTDELEGEGILMYPSGDEYQGTISKGEPEGRGLFKGKDGTVLMAIWSNGKILSEIIDEEDEEDKAEETQGTEVYVEDETEPQILTIEKTGGQENVSESPKVYREVGEAEFEEEVQVVKSPVYVEEHHVEVKHAEIKPIVEIETESKEVREVVIPEESEVEVVYSKPESKETVVIPTKTEYSYDVMHVERDEKGEIVKMEPENAVEVIQVESSKEVEVVQSIPKEKPEEEKKSSSQETKPASKPHPEEKKSTSKKSRKQQKSKQAQSKDPAPSTESESTFQ